MKSPYVTLKKSKIHNYGLYAKKDIPANTPIIQYTGKKLTHKQVDALPSQGEYDCIYLFELNSRWVLDGDTKTNTAKYINHSCEPNCHTDMVKGQIWIFASRDIKKGEELTYDYGFQRVGWQNRPCHCASKNCFGFVVTSDHWPSIRKTKRYQKLKKSSKSK